MHTPIKACLFGGAIWAAGIPAFAAPTWSVDPQPGFVPVSIFANAIDWSTGEPYPNYSYGGYPLDIHIDANTFASGGFNTGPFVAYAGIDETGMSASVFRRGNYWPDVRTYASIGAFVTVATDTQVLIEISPGNAQSVTTSIRDWTGVSSPQDAVLLFSENRGSADGGFTQTFTLEGGRTYQIGGWSNMTTGTGEASWSVTIVPTPAATALLGWASLVAVRRRR